MEWIDLKPFQSEDVYGLKPIRLPLVTVRPITTVDWRSCKGTRCEEKHRRRCTMSQDEKEGRGIREAEDYEASYWRLMEADYWILDYWTVFSRIQENG